MASPPPRWKVPGSTWKAPFEALEDAGIHAALFHAQHVKQIRGKKTDVNDSLWLPRICQFGLAQPSYVPPRRFRQLRQLTRYRRKLVAERSRNRNRIHKRSTTTACGSAVSCRTSSASTDRRILDRCVFRPS